MRSTPALLLALLSAGSIAAAEAPPLDSVPPTGSTARTCGDREGRYGDIDGDGTGDAVVADPAAEVDGFVSAGSVTVVYSRMDSVEPLLIEVLRQGDGVVPGKSSADDRFGSSLEVGYVDGDTCADVLIGVPGERVSGAANAGTVVVLFGSVGGLGRGRPAKVWKDGSLEPSGVPEKGDRFGTTIAMPTGSFWNGIRAVAIGSPSEDVGAVIDAGSVTFTYLDVDGRPVQGSNQVVTQSVTGLVDTPETGDKFGTALAVGDIVSYSDAALLIGTPNESIGSLAHAGVVDVVSGLEVGETPTGVRWTEDNLGDEQVAEAGERFGAAITASRDDFTTISKVAIGAPGEDVEERRDAGRVFVVTDYDGTVPPQAFSYFDQSTPSFNQQAEVGDRFGSHLTALQRNATGTATLLLIGIPSEDLRGVVDAGLIQTYGLDFPRQDIQSLHQLVAGVPGNLGEGDEFGAVVGGLPHTSLESPGALLVGLPHDAEYPHGAVLVRPYLPIYEGEPDMPQYALRMWIPGEGGFAAGGNDFGGAISGLHGDGY